jgi:DNA polymerase III subunit delta'
MAATAPRPRRDGATATRTAPPPPAGPLPLVGHEAARAALSRAIRGQEAEEPAQAYLFTGPTGVGKRALALWFARLLHCQARRQSAATNSAPLSGDAQASTGANPHGGAAGAELWEPCGSCLACRKHASGNHTDLVEIVAGELERRPDGTQVVTRARALKVAQIRDELLPETRFAPREARVKLLLLAEAEKITAAAYEALLKTLEEPLPGHVFVLCSPGAEQVPATIRSRCRLLRLGPVARPQLAAWLQAQGIEPLQALQAAAIADGRPGRALSLCEDDKLWARRQEWIDWLVTVAEGEPVEAIELGEKFTERSAYAKASPDDKRVLLTTFFEMSCTWFRDLLLLHQGLGSSALYNVDQEPLLRRIAAHYSTPRLLGALEAINVARAQHARNVNTRLMLVRLFVALGAAR